MNKFESGGYPAGAEYDSNAPWNQKDPKPIELEVTVIQTLSTTIKVPVTDYEEDEEGCIDTSNCNLPEAVREVGITTPYDLIKKANKDSKIKWYLDDYQIIEE